MKKRERRREIELLSTVEEIRPEEMKEIVEEPEKYGVDYNSLMEEYENGAEETLFLFILTGNNDKSIYQLIPLFCKHFTIQLYRIQEKIHFAKRTPHFLRVKKDQKIGKELTDRLLSRRIEGTNQR